MEADNTGPNAVSFIGIVDFSQDANWLYCSESVYDLLGWEPSELLNRPSLELLHPDEYAIVKQLHYDTISQDKAAVIAYMRMRHKDPFKGYILCAISRTIVQNVSLGAVSFATPGPKAMHTASTATEITVITPSATDFEFRRWCDTSPMPASPTPSIWHSPKPASPGPSASPTDPISPSSSADYLPLPSQSPRTALILDRYTLKCTILYVTNDTLVNTIDAMGRSLWDFVCKKDEELVRSWIDAIKGWGVNERGQPSDGGFGFGRFLLIPDGRDSSVTDDSEVAPVRRRSQGGSKNSSGIGRHNSLRGTASPRRGGSSNTPTSTQVPLERQIFVDAIFSAHSDGILLILRAR